MVVQRKEAQWFKTWRPELLFRHYKNTYGREHKSFKNNFVGIILNTQNSRTEHYFWGFEKQTRTKRNRFRNLEKEQKKNILYELVCTVYTSTVHTFIVFLRGRKTITGMIQSN